MKLWQNKLLSGAPENLCGDFQPLIEQLGSANGLALVANVPASLRLDGVKDLPTLKRFLEDYREQLLAAVEFPLICRAHSHASRNEFSELLALDQQLIDEPCLKIFSVASQRVGRIQLKRLRPLRDQRGLQRYLRAVDDHKAHAWHTLVYGITLACFSIPLRQGLLNYAEQVFNGFISAAAHKFEFTEMESDLLLAEICATIPSAIENSLAQSAPAKLKLT